MTRQLRLPMTRWHVDHQPVNLSALDSLQLLRNPEMMTTRTIPTHRVTRIVDKTVLRTIPLQKLTLSLLN